MRDCDCGTCCDTCGHLDNCIRWDLLLLASVGDMGWDVAAQVAAEDGVYL